MQFSIQANVQGLVDSTLWSYSYNVGIPIVYAYKDRSICLRLFHFCSHLSRITAIRLQEQNKKVPKVAFFENLDLTLSYEWSEGLRFYGGVGVVVHGHIISKSLYRHRTGIPSWNGLFGFDKRFAYCYLPSLDLFLTLFVSLDLAFWPWLRGPGLTTNLGI